MTNPPKLLYRVAHVAELLDCSPQQVRLLAHAGRIPGFFRVGRMHRFQKAAVDRWYAEQLAAGKNPSSNRIVDHPPTAAN